MATEPIVLHLNDGLGEAEKLFKKNRVRHLPVVSGAKIVGILSMTDLARISFVDSYDPHDFTIDTSVYSLFTLEQIMVRKPTCIPDKATIKEVAEIFWMSISVHSPSWMTKTNYKELLPPPIW